MKDSFKRMFRNVNPAIVIIILILLVNKMLNSNQSIGLETDDVDIDTSLERKSLESKKKFAMNKKTRLTNCL